MKYLDVSSDLFPSGPWIGFYKYSRSDTKYRMDLDLTFTNGNMTGTGSDNVGRFLIRGRYDASNLECHWTKSYLGAHDVFYRGFREGKGIWGVWEIGRLSRGGFHIWPLHSGAAEEETLSAEEAQPVEAIGVESAGMSGAVLPKYPAYGEDQCHSEVLPENPKGIPAQKPRVARNELPWVSRTKSA